MNILLAPDKFKDALRVEEVCDAMAAGVRQALPDADVTVCPLADGGEGTGRLLARALGAQQRSETVLDPLGRRRAAHWWLSPDHATALVEMAEASGLWHLSPHERSAVRTTSYGTGQLIRAALDAGAGRIMLCVGGSATVDGGAGCLQALGWQLFDAAGHEVQLPAYGGMLQDIVTLRPPRDCPSVEIDILCDVDNPLVGPRGAAPVFGPQKGASTEDVALLSAGLEAWADTLGRAGGRPVRDAAGGGAAGGLPAGLAATLDARLRSGFDCVAEILELDTRLSPCDLCLTGEGRLDQQTVGGKVIAGVARRARQAGVPVVAFVGAIDPSPKRKRGTKLERGQHRAELARSLGLRDIIVITPAETPLNQALLETADNLKRAVAEHLRSGSSSY